jgi:two-component sensor histidine kinase
VDLDCRVDEVDLDVDQAISLGLIVNELITNSLKYAFPDGRRGMIWIVLKRTTAGEVELTVSDNGVGQDAAAALDSSTAFGTELIAMMAQKLRATLQRPEGAEGAGYVTRLRFGI